MPSVPPKGGRKHPQQEFLQSIQPIFYSFAGRFHGLEEHHFQSAWKKKGMGFGADVRRKSDHSVARFLTQVQPEDLLKYGSFPNSLAASVVSTLSELDEKALIRSSLEPRCHYQAVPEAL